MKKVIVSSLLIAFFLCSHTGSFAQAKTGYISMTDLLTSMPDSRKADTALNEYREALQQQYESYKKDYDDQVALLTSKDTAKFTKAQLDIKKQALTELLTRMQGYNQQANQQLEQKRQELIAPIQKKAQDAIQAVAKENGYAYVLEKDMLHVYPPGDDLLPLVKKKLGMQ